MRLLLVILLLAHLAPAQTGKRIVGRTVAITIDDLPIAPGPETLPIAQDVNRRILATLQKHRVPAIGFVNESKVLIHHEVDAHIALLEAWLKAGMDLGNHTFSHPDINTLPLRDYEDDIVRGDILTKQALRRHGRTMRWFRHPFTHTGPTPELRAGLDKFLAARGYTTAPFTIENADWMYNAVYVDALARDPALAERVRQTYLDQLQPVFEFFEEVSNRTFQREIPQVLLIHVNRLTADTLDEMLTRLTRRGYRFASLDEVMTDEAYASQDGYTGPHGPSWLHRWRAAKGMQDLLSHEPDPPKWLHAEYDALLKRRGN